MKDLQDRLKTVKEVLTHAKFIRVKGNVAASGEANLIEAYLENRKTELETKISELKRSESQARQPELTHAE